MKRKIDTFDILWKILVCIAAISALVMILMTNKANRIGRGEITVYGINGIVAHYDDAEYERAKDMVIVYDGDRELRYINCNVEVKE